MTHRTRAVRLVAPAVVVTEQADRPSRGGRRCFSGGVTGATGARQMHRRVMRTARARRRFVTAGAFRGALVMRPVTGGALDAARHGHWRRMAARATEIRACLQMRRVTELDVAMTRRTAARQSDVHGDRAGGGQRVPRVASGAFEPAIRVVVARRAVPRRADVGYAMRRAGSMTAAAGQSLMPLMGEGTAARVGGGVRGRVDRQAGERLRRRERRGARRPDDGGSHGDKQRPQPSPAHAPPLWPQWFTRSCGGGASCGRSDSPVLMLVRP